MPTTIWSENFESVSNQSTADKAYDNSGNISYFPSGWEKLGDTSNGTGTSMVVGKPWRDGTTNAYWQVGPGLQSATYGAGKNFSFQYQRGWVVGYGSTGSGSTGPYGANDNSTTEGGFAVNQRHLFIETTQTGTATYADATNKYRTVHLIRTDEIDLTSYSATDDIRLEGYFHMYGTYQGALGFACTTSDTIAGEQKFNGEIGWVNNAAFTGSGFTGYTNDNGTGTDGGGLTIAYDSNGDGTLDVTTSSAKKRIVGQQQTSGHTTSATPTAANKWRKFSADMTGAGGQNVYLYILVEAQNQYSLQWNSNLAPGSQYYKSDTCLDNLSVKFYEPQTNDSDHYEGKIFSIAGSSIQKICNEDLDEDDKVFNSEGTVVAATPTNHRIRILLNGTDGTWTGDSKEAVIMHTHASTGNLTDDTAFDFGDGDYQTLGFPTGNAFINMLIRFENVPGGNSTWSVDSAVVTENLRTTASGANPNGLGLIMNPSYSSGGGYWQMLLRIGDSANYRADSTITVTWTD